MAPYGVISAACCAVNLLLFSCEETLTEQRERMVREQIEARGVRNADVLRVLRSTPRHLFVPANLREYAYSDQPLPIGLGQTISQPYVVALMTELLTPEKTDRVLEIGTGSGYQAAVLAGLVKHVFTMEIVTELANSARERLAAMGCRNVTVRQGDGYKGWPEEAPFDKIMLTAAPPEVPPRLLEQLARGGRLVAPVGDSPATQELVVVEKTRAGEMRRRSVAPVAFVPMVPERTK
ncbi:MAG TPA: protein-L-isoaspartate(D-aspartate) O-methyltransferase [Bryobacteraceae bacterium]|nr:protein-L-isoaspartate(D-aspartate) O-methyltransferase [Bryobacteraceae bacterium]